MQVSFAVSANKLLSKIVAGVHAVRAFREQVLIRKNGRLELALCCSVALHLVVLALSSPMAGGGITGAPRLDSRVFNAILSPVPGTVMAMSATDEKRGQDVAPELAMHQRSNVEVRPDEIGRTAPEVPSPVAPRKADPPSLPQPAASPDVPGSRGSVGLGKQPRLLGEIVLEYPTSAGDREGRVTLRIVVSASGSVDEITVISSDPPGVFDEAAMKAFSMARFSPGEMFGVPVRASIVVEIDYLPTGRGNMGGRGY